MCNVYIALRQLGWATSTARTIPDSGERIEALCNVAIAYANDQSWKQAEEIAEEINDERKQDEVWAAFADKYASTGLWKQAQTFFDKIRSTDLL